jgi:hypothetical protein
MNPTIPEVVTASLFDVAAKEKRKNFSKHENEYGAIGRSR